MNRMFLKSIEAEGVAEGIHAFFSRQPWPLGPVELIVSCGKCEIIPDVYCPDCVVFGTAEVKSSERGSGPEEVPYFLVVLADVT